MMSFFRDCHSAFTKQFDFVYIISRYVVSRSILIWSETVRDLAIASIVAFWINFF